MPTEEEWDEIATALRLLNHHTARNREEYLSRICANKLALKVKLNDLRSNMDVCHIAEPTEKDMEKQKRYKQEYERLMKSLDNMAHFDIASCDVKLEKHKNGKLDYEL